MLLATFLCLCTYAPRAQSLAVTGTVSEVSGDPLPGVSVTLKGSTYGVTTGSKGNYSVAVSDENAVLVFSYVGYSTQEIVVGKRTVMNVVMQETAQEIDEVVVVAYGVARKSTFTGSATAVKSERLEKISGSGFAEALQGLSAGVNVVNNQGNPGGESRIQIRGIGTMGRSADVDATRPLYIVDGMPFEGSPTSIAQSDIESMTVLKDAAASSLYGSRAANGVVVVTTRKGKVGKPVINFKASWGTSDFAVKNPVKSDPRQHLTNTWEGLYNDQVYKYGRSDADARKHASANVLDAILVAKTNSRGETTYVSPFRHVNEPYVLESGQVNPNLQLIWNKEDYDWSGSMFSYKLRQDYSLDVGGSSKEGKTKYYFSGSWLDDQGYALSHYYKRHSFRANVSSEITDWLEAGANLAYGGSRQNASGYNRLLIFTTTMASPYLRNIDNTDWVYSEKTGARMYSFGDYNKNFFGQHPMAISGDYWNNPDDHDFNNTETSMISSRFFVRLNLPFDLQFKSNLSIDNNNSTGYQYGSAVHGQGQLEPYGVTVKTTGGWAARSTGRSLSATWNNILSLDKRYGEHSVNALLGHELYSYDYNYNYGYGEGIMQLDQYELTSTTTNWAIDSHRHRYALLSFLAKADYGYGNKYYLSASYRRDGSSRFHKNERWGDFFSVGASWRISGEPFMNGVSKTLSNLMLRGSYGTSGNDKLIDNNGSLVYYGYQATYEAYDMYGKAGLRPSTVATPELKWEKNAQFNLALDFSLFNRVNATVEYYNRSSKDLLYYKELPPSSQSGTATGMNTNLGNILNSGVEVTLNANIIRTNDFSWDADLNWTSQHNEITYLPGGEYTFTSRVSTYKIAEGHSRWEFFMPSFAGVDPANGKALYYVKDANGGRTTTDDFSKVTLDDYEWQGSALPKGFASFTNSFRWKGFDLSFMFYASFGGKMFDYNWLERVTLRNGVGVIPELTEDRWRKPGDQASQPRWSYEDYMSTRQATNYFLFDNSFVRLRNVTLGYTLPKSLVSRAGLGGVRVWLSADNLFTFGSAANRYTEPETEVTGNNYNGSELTDSGYPGSRRVFTGGIKFSF